MIDLELIKTLRSCQDGLDDYTNLFGVESVSFFDFFSTAKPSDAIWLISRMSRKQTLPDYIYNLIPVKYHHQNREEFLKYLHNNWPEFLARLNDTA